MNTDRQKHSESVFNSNTELPQNLFTHLLEKTEDRIV